jgi:hypothetical protein
MMSGGGRGVKKCFLSLGLTALLSAEGKKQTFYLLRKSNCPLSGPTFLQENFVSDKNHFLSFFFTKLQMRFGVRFRVRYSFPSANMKSYMKSHMKSHM